MVYSEIGAIAIALLSWMILSWVREKRWSLPPGPRRLPLVGNLHHLGRQPCESFAKLAEKHGPIMTVWLGAMRTVVISSSEVAREMFKNHDTALAGRTIYESMKGEHGNVGSLVSAHYGPQWKLPRRLCNIELFVGSRLDATQSIRAGSIDRMIKHVEKLSGNGRNSINIYECFYSLALNHIANLMFSLDLEDPKLENGSKYYYHLRQIMEICGKPNVADFVPVLKCIDPQGIKRMTQFHTRQAFEAAEGIIEERRQSRTGGHGGEDRRRDFLDMLLDFRGNGANEPSSLSSDFMKSLITEIFAAGTDTTPSTLEWAMTELLRNPTILKKLQVELTNDALNPDSKLEEKDVENLPYLNAIIKETLRLHPPSPLLVPHMAMESCKMLGYDIPKETQILVNVWAIGRDPKTWKDPLVFKPERFLDQNSVVDYKGNHFQYIPFGSGRRMCPAIPLASRLLPLALGSLLRSFNWVLADGIKPEEIDMGEKMGFTLRKAIPLKAVAIPVKEKLSYN